MEYKSTTNLIHKKPREDYPYAASAKIFHTDQLFLYSELVEPKTKSSAPHFHKKIDEAILIVEGELWAYEDDQSKLLKQGDSICFKANSQKNHYLKNKSDQKARFLLFRSSLSFGEGNDVSYEE